VYLADAKCLRFCDDTKASLAAVAAAAAQGLVRTELPLDTPANIQSQQMTTAVVLASCK